MEAHFFDGPLRSSSLRSLGAYANLFAIESFMDELASSAGKDPFEFRLAHLDDPRARAVVGQLRKLVRDVPTAGIAFSRYKNNGAYCAVAAEVARVANHLRVLRMWAVIDAGEVINMDGIKNQTEGGMVQSASWTMQEQVSFDSQGSRVSTGQPIPCLISARPPRSRLPSWTARWNPRWVRVRRLRVRPRRRS
ncbi:molybdopterin cofactor-binding domain-containing protein [Puia sp. P3]|uniref:molybdopterin cofactor-binding domain-containing protein n=1 Tax=Puia sp. P3 TaxID=3423952 RepID=UPI003D672662